MSRDRLVIRQWSPETGGLIDSEILSKFKTQIVGFASRNSGPIFDRFQTDYFIDYFQFEVSRFVFLTGSDGIDSKVWTQ